MKKTIKIIVVYLSNTLDGITAVYHENGELWFYGDYYHDKINDYIAGVVDGLKFCGYEVTIEKKSIDMGEDCCEPPETLGELNV